MKEKIAFVQFLHPGVEHISGEWNTCTKTHKRRFIKQYGSYIEGENIYFDELTFWCEWEAQAKKLKNLSCFEKGNPKYLWQPYYCLSADKNLQNTDPFIFGEHFHYVCCRQWKNKNPTQLQFLKQGSVILFGSNLNGSFVLDTVFVVDKYKDIESIQDVSNEVEQAYTNVTLTQILRSYSCASSHTWTPPKFRLYFGAKYTNPLNGMFSFFPCLPYQNQTTGFCRPIIQIEGLIINKLNQNFNLTETLIESNQQLWLEVKKQVETTGLKIGIEAQLPLKH